MKVLFATAEIAPIARVGGMAEATSGLVKQLRNDGVDVTLAIPDYNEIELADEKTTKLLLPEWARPGLVRSGTAEGLGNVNLVRVPWIKKPHPYTDAKGRAFADNDLRFLGFSAAVAALISREMPDVVHLNDWHTATALGFLVEAPPSVLAIHNLGYQGVTNPGWMDQIPTRAHYFAWYGGTNPLLGGIRLADRVVTVSPNYANEILSEENGMGLHQYLNNLGGRLSGIVNGIDTDEWNPATDPHLPRNYSYTSRSSRAFNREKLLEEFGLAPASERTPVFGLVTRLVEQKGIDLLCEVIKYLEKLPARVVVLGTGDEDLTRQLKHLETVYPKTLAFMNAYDSGVAHRIFGGADILLMPSRFEPCGLAQMQAMTYGTIPVVTDVGGLRDTVIDDDEHTGTGTGFISASVDPAGLVDAIHRATRAWKDRTRRAGLQRRGMQTDWGWAKPAAAYQELYRGVVKNRRPTAFD